MHQFGEEPKSRFKIHTIGFRPCIEGAQPVFTFPGKRNADEKLAKIEGIFFRFSKRNLETKKMAINLKEKILKFFSK